MPFFIDIPLDIPLSCNIKEIILLFNRLGLHGYKLNCSVGSTLVTNGDLHFSGSGFHKEDDIVTIVEVGPILLYLLRNHMHIMIFL